MQKLGPERVYICLEAVFSTEREIQVADKLISGGIQVPISPSYSPCDLGQMVSFLRSCFLTCPWGIMWWAPRVTVKIRWHSVCRSAVSARKCVCKEGTHVCVTGWSCWALLWWGASLLILQRCWSGSKKDRKWGVSEPEEPAEAHVVHNWRKHKREGVHWKGSPHHRPPASVPSCPIPPFLLPRSSLLWQSSWAASHVVPQVPLSTYKHMDSPEPPFLKYVICNGHHPCFFQETIS